MKQNESRSSDQLMREFAELFEAAKVIYPNLSETIETYTTSRVEMESFQTYLNLKNQTPDVVTANSAT